MLSQPLFVVRFVLSELIELHVERISKVFCFKKFCACKINGMINYNRLPSIERGKLFRKLTRYRAMSKSLDEVFPILFSSLQFF